MGLLRTLFIILAGYYLLRFLLRLVSPFLAKKVIINVREKVHKKYDQSRQGTKGSFAKEGETVIDKKPKSGGQSGNPLGEYIDFEEID